MSVEIAMAAALMASLGVGLSALLAIANSRLYVEEDPRIDIVEDLLPKANCGACGQAGCRAFAEQVVEGKVAPSLCTVSSPKGIEAIASFLGVEAGKQEKRVARLACAGGRHVAKQHAIYEGMTSCRAAHLVGGGGKGCSWGCLGLADCMEACKFGAITMNAYGLPVVDETKCTACNDCVVACPRHLFTLQPVSRRLWVACMSLSKGDEAERECEVACTGCGLCAADAPGVIAIQNNLAVVDYTKNGLATPDAIQRCPTGAIVWLDDHRGAVKGANAKKITRKSPLPIM
ncbi:MAG: ferredoxin [Candidatus Hydrogenedentota bacterium]